MDSYSDDHGKQFNISIIFSIEVSMLHNKLDVKVNEDKFCPISSCVFFCLVFFRIRP